MDVLRVDAELSAEGVEGLLTRIKSASATTDLLLPRKLKGWHAGAGSSLLQAILTWGNRAPSGTLRVYAHDLDSGRAQIDALADTPHGLVGLLSAERVSGQQAELALTDHAHLAAAKRAVARSTPSTWAARNFGFIVLADHLSIRRNRLVHTSRGKPASREAFASLIHSTLRRMMGRQNFEALPREGIEQLALTAHELFRNTEHWARTDTNNRPMRPSVRGIELQFHNLEADVLRKHIADTPQLATSLLSAENTSEGRSRFIELAVFDSGPGLTKRWLGKSWRRDLDAQIEAIAIASCFNKHNTTAQVGQHRGLGLYSVMRASAALGALLRVRTGHLSLFRDFKRHPFDEETVDIASLADWETGSGRFVSRAPVIGTLYSVLVPIRRPA